MNKKDILEIRKQFSPKDCCLTRICGCYVDGEKNIKFRSKDAFLSLPEEEAFKYFDIFKKGMSGSLGKNLHFGEFPLHEEKEGGCQHFLMQLRDSKLEDDMLLEEFYQKVIENYSYGENYYIILVHGAYDIPGKASDGAEMFDASDEVYQHIYVCICPVNLSKGGLSYSSQDNCMIDRIRDWVVDPPANAFLFPAFCDRASDIHGLLYYSKKPDDLQEDFVASLLGARLPLTAKDQKETFKSVIEDSLGEQCEFEMVKTIHENLQEILKEKGEEEALPMIGKREMKRAFSQSGASEEQLEKLEEAYNNSLGEQEEFISDNVFNQKQMEIKTPDILIKIQTERSSLLEKRIINNRPCLVIPMDDRVEINGVSVRSLSPDDFNEDAD